MIRKVLGLAILAVWVASRAAGQTYVPFAISLTVTDPLTGTVAVTIGMAPGASYCLDPAYGEVDLPPLPPPGVLEFRSLNLPGESCLGFGVLTDIHPLIAPAAVDSYYFFAQPGDGTMLTIAWPANIADVAGGYWWLVPRDRFGDLLPPVAMNGKSSLTLPSTSSGIQFHVVHALTQIYAPMELAISDASIRAGTSGMRNMQFTVNLSAPAAHEVQVDYRTQDGSAIAGTDYTAVSGRAVFAIGDSVRTVLVPIHEDPLPEPDETLYVVLSNPSNATIQDSIAAGVIQNWQPFTIPITLTEELYSRSTSIGVQPGATFCIDFEFGEQEVPPPPPPGALDFRIRDFPGSDCMGMGVLTDIHPLLHPSQIDSFRFSGQREDLRDVTIHWPHAIDSVAGGYWWIIPHNSDNNPMDAVSMSATDSLLLPVTRPNQHAFSFHIVRAPVSDYISYSLSIADATLEEGNDSTGMSFTVSLHSPKYQAVTVRYAIEAGTATAGSDFVAASGMLTFPAGQTVRTIHAGILGDHVMEQTETLYVRLFNPVNAVLGDSIAAGILTNDDFISTVSCDVNQRWNLVSIPLEAQNPDRSFLFPTSTSEAFGYATGYSPHAELEHGRGYWLRFGSDATVSLSGVLYDADTIVVNEGWNLIGSVAVPVPVSSIQSVPAGIGVSPFFGYTGRYTVANTILPGKGYWVKADQAGKLFLGAGAANLPAMAGKVRLEIAGELPPPPPTEGEELASEMPKEYFMAQNYPNPFNPSTTIRYQLPEESAVRLVLCSMLGEELQTIVNGIEPAGEKSIQLDASGFSSGIYFYRLDASSIADPAKHFRQVRKMMLVK